MAEGSERQKIVWNAPAPAPEIGVAAPEVGVAAPEVGVSAGASAGGAGNNSRRGGHGGRRYIGTKHVFLTGMDLFTSEEVKKREKRAERFSTELGLAYKPVEVADDIREDEEKKKKRAERFGTEYKPADLSGLMEVDLLEKRREAEASSSSRLDTIHVYGVDLLSTKEILQYFQEYLPQYVEWINDSSCNVVFSDSDTAKRVLAGLGKPLAESMDSVDQLYKSMGKTWHKGEDFVKSGGSAKVPLIFRLATDEDVKPRGKGRNTRGLWLNDPSARQRYAGGRRGGGGRYGRKRRGGYDDGDVDMQDADYGRGAKKHRGGDLRRLLNASAAPPAPAPEDAGREAVSYADI